LLRLILYQKTGHSICGASCFCCIVNYESDQLIQRVIVFLRAGDKLAAIFLMVALLEGAQIIMGLKSIVGLQNSYRYIGAVVCNTHKVV